MSEASEKTQFKRGNQAWRARSNQGRKPIFKTPDELERACIEYFEWCESTPLMAVELVKYQGDARQVQVPRMRAMTIIGLCNFLDISHQTWLNYKAKPDFLGVTERVESIIYVQKFEGAAADLLNGNIIARELGLTDKQEVRNRGGFITHIESESLVSLPNNGRDMTLEEATRIYQDNLKALRE